MCAKIKKKNNSGAKRLKICRELRIFNYGHSQQQFKLHTQVSFFLSFFLFPPPPPPHDRPRSAGPTLPPTLCQCCVVGRVGDVERSMRGTRRTIAVILTCRKCNESSLGRPTSAYRSSRKRNILYFRHQSNICVSASSEHQCNSLVNSTGLNNKPQKLVNAPNNEVDMLRITTSLFRSH